MSNCGTNIHGFETENKLEDFMTKPFNKAHHTFHMSAYVAPPNRSILDT